MKAIYNTNTGLIYTFVNQDQNAESMLPNWSNTAIANIDFIPNKSEVFNYKIDLNTLQMIKV